MSDREHKEFGARRRLTDDELDQLRRLAGLLNVEQIAAYFGVSKVNFDKMVKEDPEIMKIYQQGRASTIGTVAQTLVRKALDGDTQSLIFYLRTQGRWTEKLDVEVKGEVTLASALREMAQSKVIEGDVSEIGRLDDAQSKRKLIDQRVTDKGKNSAATMTADDAADRLVKGAKISATNRRRKARRRSEGA